jgi:hypothetical protein
MPPKATKKKKGISLTPEKKKLLKQLIMQKAAEELKKQQEKEAEEKKKVVESRVSKLQIEGLAKDALEKKVRELYVTVCRLEEEKYDWEARLGRQTEEINELNIKVNDIKGKFSKPVLKKVSKTQTKMAKFDKEAMKKTKLAITTLKSTGQSKFAIDEKEEEKKPGWGVDSLQKHKEAEAEAEAEASSPEEEEKEEEEEEEE